MKAATVVCVALCMLAVLVTDISARPRRGGFRSRITVSPAERELEFLLCEELVGNMTAVWEAVSDYTCHEDVLEELKEEKEDEKEQSRVRRDDSSDEDDEEDDDSSDEEGDNSSDEDDRRRGGEGFRAFSCARCETRGCARINKRLACKLELLEEALIILDREGCPTTTTEFAETTTEQQETTTTTS